MTDNHNTRGIYNYSLKYILITESPFIKDSIQEKKVRYAIGVGWTSVCYNNWGRDKVKLRCNKIWKMRKVSFKKCAWERKREMKVLLCRLIKPKSKNLILVRLHQKRPPLWAARKPLGTRYHLLNKIWWVPLHTSVVFVGIWQRESRSTVAGPLWCPVVYLIFTQVTLLGVLLIDSREIVYSVVHDIVRVQRVPEVAGDLLHGDAPALIVFTKVHVGFVGKGESEEDSSK